MIDNIPKLDISVEEKNELDKKKLLIAIPFNGTKISFVFMMALEKIKCIIGGEWLYDPSVFAYINTKNGWIIYYERNFGRGEYEVARNQIAVVFEKLKFDNILMLDSDMWYHPLTPYILLRHDKDVVSGLYFSRHLKNGRHGAALFIWDQENDKLGMVNEINPNYMYSGLLENGNYLVGGGFLMVKREVFEKLDFPYFEWIMKYDPIKKRVIKNLGEDIYFCKKITRAGYQIAVDTDLLALHEADDILLPYDLNYLPSINYKIQELQQ